MDQEAGNVLLNPIGLFGVTILGLVQILITRRYATLPLLILICFMPAAQRMVVLNLDFNMLRLLLIFGWVRVLLRGEMRGYISSKLDKCVIVYACSSITLYTISRGGVGAFVYQLGAMYDFVGWYFLLRLFIKDLGDLDGISFCLATVSIPAAGFFIVEFSTGRNLFSIFGGIPEYTLIRQGALRCQGAFSHPIMAGCFWASLTPLIGAGVKGSSTHRILAVVGVCCAVSIVIMTSSSTPAMGLVACLIGWIAFYLRVHLRIIRLAAVSLAIVLHLVMQAPVWHLISRITVFGGNTGWHRYNLIDQAIRRFGEWALVGTVSTTHWGFLLNDVTNQYVLEGIEGGVVKLSLFVVLIALVFKNVGYASRSLGKSSFQQALVWAVGVVLFVHCVNFIGVSYFGQMRLCWILTLAMGAVLPIASGIGRVEANYEEAVTPQMGIQ